MTFVSHFTITRISLHGCQVVTWNHTFYGFQQPWLRCCDIQITYEDTHICIGIETKFLGLFINNNLSWKTHTECIKAKLSSACYAMQTLKPHASINTLKIIYYSYLHSIMTYDQLFWGHSSDSIKIFRLQKKIIRIMMGYRSSDSCWKLFFNLQTYHSLPNTFFLSFCLW